MSRFFPHPPYAEDQPLAHTILITHSLLRSFEAGAALGVCWHVGRGLLCSKSSKTSENTPTSTRSSRSRNGRKKDKDIQQTQEQHPNHPNPSSSPNLINTLLNNLPQPPRTAELLNTTSLASLLGLGLWTLALPIKMWGKQPIQWQDYSWRILENRGQVLLDDWCLSGVVLGGFWAFSMGERDIQQQGRGEIQGEGQGEDLYVYVPAWRRVLAGAGIGGLGGILGLLVVRVIGRRVLRGLILH